MLECLCLTEREVSFRRRLRDSDRELFAMCMREWIPCSQKLGESPSKLTAADKFVSYDSAEIALQGLLGGGGGQSGEHQGVALPRCRGE